MKKFSVLLLLVSFATICFAQENKKNDLALLNLKGNVKYIEESTYYPKSKVITKDSEFYEPEHRRYFVIKYNKEGNIDHAIIKDRAYGRVFKIRTEQYIYKYNEKGNKIERNYLWKDVFDINYKYDYDEQGNMIKESSFNKDNSPGQIFAYKYDSKRNKIDMSSFDEKDKLLYRNTYEYDSKGNMIKENFFDKNNDFSGYSIFKYDKKGNKIEKFDYSNKDSLELRISYKYDKQGNEIEEKTYKGNGDLKYINTYKYKYDNKSNWIEKKSLSKSDEVYETIKRKIVYYGDKDENNYPSWDDINYKADEIKIEGVE